MEINSMHSLNQIRSMEVIDINMGVKLGYIKDLKIDCESYKIISILIPENKGNWIGKWELKEIPWQDIVKIGIDVILVNYNKENTKDM